ADMHVCARIPEQVADHAHAAGCCAGRARATRSPDVERHKHDDVRAGLSERGMNRMPDPLPTEDDAARLDALPADVEGPTTVADPLGPPLELSAGAAALTDELVAKRSLPVRRVEAVRRGQGRGQPGGKIDVRRAHWRASAEPTSIELVGAIIGPEVTRAT